MRSSAVWRAGRNREKITNRRSVFTLRLLFRWERAGIFGRTPQGPMPMRRSEAERIPFEGIAGPGTLWGKFPRDMDGREGPANPSRLSMESTTYLSFGCKINRTAILLAMRKKETHGPSRPCVDTHFSLRLREWRKPRGRRVAYLT